jgi:hypothetical protein
MSVYKDKCLIVTTNPTSGTKRAQFMSEKFKNNGFVMSTPEILLDPK